MGRAAWVERFGRPDAAKASFRGHPPRCTRSRGRAAHGGGYGKRPGLAAGWLALAVWLAGCGTPSVLTDPRAEQRRIGPDLFHVLVEDDTATVANFSTGANLMLRVEEGARAAVEDVSGCRVVHMVKFDAINRWQARLRCPPG